MAESEGNRPDLVQDQEKEGTLKYLDFVRVASIYATVYLSNFYAYAKENSGPLKQGVETVEGTVKTVVGPIHEMFHDVPFKLLIFADRQVDKSVIEVERHVPSLLKHASSHAITVVQKAPVVARTIASEIRRDGVLDATKSITKNVYSKYEPAAKELYSKYEPLAEHYAVSTWRTLNRLPLFPQVAELAIPTAADWSEKYNRAVSYMASRNYTAATYLPLIPKDRIAKIFEESPSVSTNGEGTSSAAQ
ncbi:stress-related protein-like isoform X1 [Neltuma alba]|uniref:stress-related protein-like isoform X1 n=1 Tax=Neltuma alba TaxID=207710 RepID=UPI0010A40482|nr:stress-related protein-like isoform X1 [Prosopis alba]